MSRKISSGLRPGKRTFTTREVVDVPIPKGRPEQVDTVGWYYTCSNGASTSTSTLPGMKNSEEVQKAITLSNTRNCIKRGINTYEDYQELAYVMKIPLAALPDYEDVDSVELDEKNNIIFNFKPQEIPDDQKPTTE